MNVALAAGPSGSAADLQDSQARKGVAVAVGVEGLVGGFSAKDNDI